MPRLPGRGSGLGQGGGDSLDHRAFWTQHIGDTHHLNEHPRPTFHHHSPSAPAKKVNLQAWWGQRAEQLRPLALEPARCLSWTAGMWGKCLHFSEPQFPWLPSKDPVPPSWRTCKAYRRCSARAGTTYLSCWRSSPADVHLWPAWNTSAGDLLPGPTTASALNEQH